MLLAICHVIAGYGTYVVFGTELKCRISETVIFNPKREVLILVVLTWFFQVFTL